MKGQDAGSQMPDAGCWMLDAGCNQILDSVLTPVKGWACPGVAIGEAGWADLESGIRNPVSGRAGGISTSPRSDTAAQPQRPWR